MRYDQFRAAGYLIGSGTVESGCKQIVTQRLKRPMDGGRRRAHRQSPRRLAQWRLGDPVRSTRGPALSRLTTFACTPLPQRSAQRI